MNSDNIASVEFSDGEMHLRNGRMKVKKMPANAYVAFVFFILLAIAPFPLLISGIVDFGAEYILMQLLIMVAVIFLLKISPYTQSSKSYYIEFLNENSCIGLKLYYNGKQVAIPYKVDRLGKVIMDNYESTAKIASICYIDGTNINTRTQYKITYYFVRWLIDNNLMSDDPSGTFKSL